MEKVRFSVLHAKVARGEAEETITVPAATFRTLRIVCRNKQTGSVGREIWYSPEVKFWVRYRFPEAGGFRVEELTASKLE